MTRIVPDDWMPRADMSRIHVHWTAGGHSANAVDRNAYHLLVEGNGKLVRGDHAIDSNASPRKGPRASHTLNANTGAIGVSLCCMREARERPFDSGPSPMTKVQWDAAIAAIADLAKFYGILVTPTTILTHAEVEPNLHIKQNNKWDISRLSFDDRFQSPKAVGDELRVQVASLLDEDDRDASGVEMGSDNRLPKFRVTGVSPSELNFRRTPGGEKIGSLPERSVVERLGVFDEWWRVRSRLGYVGFVHSAFLKPD